MSTREKEPLDKSKEIKDSKKVKSTTLYLLISYELYKGETKNDEISFKDGNSRTIFSEKT